MALLVAHALEQMKFELGGGDVPSELGALSILNQAGQHLYSMHPWRWTTGRSALMDLRGVLSGTSATWTAASKTLTQASAFTNYSFVSADEISVPDGTGVTSPGVHKIASRTSANAVVLATSIAAGNLATGDIEWRIDPQTIALPSDLRDIISIASTSVSAVGGVALTTLQQILDFRNTSAAVTAGSGLYWGAVVYNGTPPRPLLEIYPSPSANATGALRIFYRSRWATLSADNSSIEIPDFVQDLFVALARSYAGGYVRNNVASIHARLAEVKAGPIFEAAVRSDGMVQPYFSTIRGGGAEIWRRGYGGNVCGLSTAVEPPAI